MTQRRKTGFFQHSRTNRQNISNTNAQNISNSSINTIERKTAPTPIPNIPPDIITGYSFQFTLKSSDETNTKYITFRGSVCDDGVYQIWRRRLGTDRKDIKMSPSWLYKQAKWVCQGILRKLFRLMDADFVNLSKAKLVSLCYQKLGMTKANKKLKEKELLMFTDDEIKIILNKLKETMDSCDLETEIFNYLISTDIYLESEDFMDMLDDLISNKLFSSAAMNIYNKLVQILISTKTEKKFEKEYASFYRTRMTAQSAQALIFLLMELKNNEFRTYPVNLKHYSSVFVCSIKAIFLKHLTVIVYSLVEQKGDKKINNTVSRQYAGSFGGASLCSCLRLSYSRILGKEKRIIYVRLQKHLLCKDNEKHLVPMELTFQNMGGMYILTPSAYPFCVRILSDFSKHINQAFMLPSNRLPDVPKLIHSYVNNQQNIEEFKGFFSAQDLLKYNEYISNFMQRFVKFMCGKYYWSILKQQRFCEVGMSIRDQFNFGHTEFTKKRNKQK